MIPQPLTHRRGLLCLLTGAALTPVTAQAHVAAALAVAKVGDAAMIIEFDARLHSRVRSGEGTALTDFAPSETLRLADGSVIGVFHFTGQTREAVNDVHGAGTRFTVRGRAPQGVEKRVELLFYDRYPGFALETVTYRNDGAAPLAVAGWTSAGHVLKTSGRGFWSFSGSSHPDRRDWVQPVKADFKQANFMGMNGSDYGSGTPVADVWRPDIGLAVGHVEPTPKLVSLPIIALPAGAAVAVDADHKASLAPGAELATPQTFVSLHRRDYFATLDTYRRLMSERGLASPLPPSGSYEGIWCAWGYDRKVTLAEIEGTLDKAADLGLKWAVIDDGWQTAEGDWYLDPVKFPGGEADMIALVKAIKAKGLKPRLWVTPLAVSPGTDLLHDHVDMLLLDKDGAPQLISWWNAFYMCPAYAPTIAHTEKLVTRIFRDWGFEGVKIDGQHLNGVAPCYNPAHHHAYPEESTEKLQDFWKAVYDTARRVNPEAVVEICPCGDCYAYYNFPYMNQAPASDPESSWQVRLKGKSLKALMGPHAPFSGDHVELSDHGDDFASTVGIGAVVSTKFTWPNEGRGPDSHFRLTAEKEAQWRKWIALYNEKGLPTGTYRGELYDIGFDKPEGHVVEKNGRIYYAFYAETWNGPIELRGLGAGRYRLFDYVNGRDLGAVSAEAPRITAAFDRHLLIEATPV